MSRYTPWLIVVVILLGMFLVYENYPDTFGRITGFWTETNITYPRVNITAQNATIAEVILEDATSVGDDIIALQAGTTRFVFCNGTINDPNGVENFDDIWPNASIFNDETTYASCDQQGEWDNNDCYFLPNDTYTANCSLGNTINSTAKYVNCTFYMQFNANWSNNDLDWNCTIDFVDEDGNTSMGTDTANVSQLLAIGTPELLDFGVMAVGDIGDQTHSANCNQNPDQACGDLNQSVTNYGNVIDDFQLNGTDMSCDISGSIDVAFLHYNCTNYNSTYNNMRNLSNTLDSENCSGATHGFKLAKSSTATGDSVATSKNMPWKIQIPTVSGFCNGSIWYVAVLGQT